jgi:bifunctional non-homologous end joining protein LigD
MLKPMLASLADAPLEDPALVYEPKYDGIRALAEVAPGAPVRLWSRLGNEKTSQFPEVVEALEAWARTFDGTVVLDGELVALDTDGQPAGFQQLQSRIHRTADAGGASSRRVAYIAFDLLREGRTDLRGRPLVERRAALERVFGRQRRGAAAVLRVSDQVAGDGRALYGRAFAEGWEGLIAKRADSRYHSGKRTPDWRKIKILREQEFVVGGWTEPRQSRAHFGALLLGVYDGASSTGAWPIKPDPQGLVYVGHTGTGFDERELSRVMRLLRPLETSSCPFRERPSTNERPHWVKPDLVVQVKFTEWTDEGRLRHPVYLGLRDDKKAADVRREVDARPRGEESPPDASQQALPARRRGRGRSQAAIAAAAGRTARGAGPAPDSDPGTGPEESDWIAPVLDQLRALEDGGRDGVLQLPRGESLKVTNLRKVFWPRQKLTKGDLFRYYVQVAPFILPAVRGRPLVMKRFPDGIAGPPFYQHRLDQAPSGVRVEPVGTADGRRQLIGGDPITLLYMTQLAAISQDPWFSRVGTIDTPDYVALDLDPSPGVGFERVLDVARWIRDELATLGAFSVAKTSGADGLHVYVPLEPGTPYEAGQLFCQIVATVVSNKHPRTATIERSVKARGKRVYVDCLQNAPGKTLATAYSARASDYAGVSTPLSWQEIDDGVRREDFTVLSVPGRLARVGDLWAPLRRARGVDLARAAPRLAPR